MSSITAGTSSGTALVQSGDTTGALVIKTGGSAATAATFNADQTTTLAQPLPVASGGTGATSLSGITVGTATSATTATNLSGGSGGTIPYQTSSGTTAMLAAGTSGQVLTSAGAGSPPTWAAVAAGSRTFTASGAIASTGLPVALNNDGTVSTIANITAAGVEALVDNGVYAGTTVSAVYTGSAVILTYVNSLSNSLFCRVGTLSGSTITWGTRVQIAAGAGVSGIATCWDSTNSKLLVVFQNTNPGPYIYCGVGTVSGTSISFGSIVNIATNGSAFMAVTYDAVSDRFVLLYIDGGTGYIRGNVGYTSGTSTVWGAQTNFVTSGAGAIAVTCGTYGGTTTFMASWKDNSGYPNARAFTINPATPGFSSFGSTITVASESVATPNLVFNPDLNLFVGFYINSSNTIKYQIFSISTYNLTAVGSYTTLTTDGVSSSFAPATYDTFTKQVIIGYRKGSDGYIYNAPITMTSSTLTLGTSTAVNGTSSVGYGANGLIYYASEKKAVGGFGYSTSTTYVYSSVYTIPYSTNQSWIGVSEASAANGASVSCTILGGVNNGVSGLTIGSNYYVALTGALTTTANAYKIGRALTTTALQITGNA